jgi:hypothetical protein
MNNYTLLYDDTYLEDVIINVENYSNCYLYWNGKSYLLELPKFKLYGKCIYVRMISNKSNIPINIQEGF